MAAGTRWHRTARSGEQPCATSPHPARQSPAARPAALLRLRLPSVSAPSPPHRGPRLSHNCDVGGECTSAFTTDSNDPPHLTRVPRAPAPSSLGCAVVSASRANNARRGSSLSSLLNSRSSRATPPFTSSRPPWRRPPLPSRTRTTRNKNNKLHRKGEPRERFCSVPTNPPAKVVALTHGTRLAPTTEGKQSGRYTPNTRPTG